MRLFGTTPLHREDLKPVGLRHGVGPSYALASSLRRPRRAGVGQYADCLNPPETQAVWPGLLTSQSAEQGPILDVETHCTSIDEVVADMYEHWLHWLG